MNCLVHHVYFSSAARRNPIPIMAVSILSSLTVDGMRLSNKFDANNMLATTFRPIFFSLTLPLFPVSLPVWALLMNLSFSQTCRYARYRQKLHGGINTSPPPGDTAKPTNNINTVATIFRNKSFAGLQVFGSKPPFSCGLMSTLSLPVYANYADAELNLMPHSYPASVFQGIIGMHIYNKKDGPCRCATTHTTLTQTLTTQRRAEPDSIRPTAISVGLFCCPDNGGDV